MRDKNAYPTDDQDLSGQHFEYSINDIENTLKLQMVIYENEKQSLLCMMAIFFHFHSCWISESQQGKIFLFTK